MAWPAQRPQESSTVHSVLLVSSFQLVREVVRALIETGEDFHVAAEAGDRSGTLRIARDLRPDLILFDLDPEYAAGIETIREIIRDRPGVRVVAFSMHSEDLIIDSVLRAGVRGFLSKTGPSWELTAVLRVVAGGEAYLSPRIAARVMDWVKNRKLTNTRVPALAGLKEREIEVLGLLAEGRTSKEIAGDLNLAVETIRTYRKSLMKKLQVHNVAGLIQFAAAAGLMTIARAKESE
jgi:DNA-binding NarL/FixJ family response regulator